MMKRAMRSGAGIFALAVLFFTPGLALAEVREPMLIPGKSTLYERILTRPEAPLTEAAGTGQPIQTFVPFEMFYVYDRATVDGADHVEVGRSLSQGPEGWMPADRTIQWRQAIVLGFNNSANRDRALIFKTRDDLIETLSHEDVQARLDTLREEAIAGSLPESSPILSIEPADYIDIEQEFYVLPILEGRRIILPSKIPANLLKIASLPKNAPRRAPAPMNREELLRDYKVGITFVIDTTRSMGPYIDETRKAVQSLKDQLLSGPEADRFRFGLVGFRDNTALVPELDYVTRTFLPLSEDSNADAFLSAIDQMEPASENSNGFNEDAVAGVVTALKEMDWAPFGGRYIILITDAGPRSPGDDAENGPLAVAEVQVLAEEEDVAIFTMHLKTDSGSFDHDYAASAYGALSRFAGTQLYFPVEGGEADKFRAQVEALSTQLMFQVSSALDGRLADVMEQAPRDDISDEVQRVGRAMQLAYLGRAEGSQAPEVLEGWLTDRDPVDRRAFPVHPYLLMSRNELSTLRDILRGVVDLGKSQTSSSDDFFASLRETVGLITRRPEAVQDAGTLGEILGEYLEGLPYTSEVLNITESTWLSMSSIQERNLVDTLESKVEALEHIHDQAERWVALTPDAPDGEYVTVVPLRLMP